MPRDWFRCVFVIFFNVHIHLKQEPLLLQQQSIPKSFALAISVEGYAKHKEFAVFVRGSDVK